MSNIGKKIINIQEGVQVQVNDGRISVSGPKGKLEMKIPEGITVQVENNTLKVQKINDERDLDKFFGLTRSLVANMVKGVSGGFDKKLELTGVGYRARTEGNQLILNVGFVNPIKITPPQGISFKIDENIITVSGISKDLVGDVSSKIHMVRPPDPYKGKGIKFVGRRYRKKVGKAAKAVGGTK